MSMEGTTWRFHSWTDVRALYFLNLIAHLLIHSRYIEYNSIDYVIVLIGEGTSAFQSSSLMLTSFSDTCIGRGHSLFEV